MLKLEIVQVYELAAVAPRYILGSLQIVSADLRDYPAAIGAAVYQCRLLFCYSCHSKSACK
jgi:hypothetical protein